MAGDLEAVARTGATTAYITVRFADEPDVFRAAWDRLADMFGTEAAAQAA